MIAPLRRRHRWMSAVLLVVVPLLYLLAILARPASPVMGEIPAAIAAEAGPPTAPESGGDG